MRRQNQGGAGGLRGQEDGQQVGRQARDGDRGGQGEHGQKGKSIHLSLLTPPQVGCSSCYIHSLSSKDIKNKDKSFILQLQTRSWVSWMDGVDGDFLDTSIVVEETGKVKNNLEIIIFLLAARVALYLYMGLTD